MALEAGTGQARRKPNPERLVDSREALITGLDPSGRGVARVEGKVVFIDGALPGERVHYEVYKRKRRHAEARLAAILEPSPQRVTPKCPHFGVCGGCALQHLDAHAQVLHKQRDVLDKLRHLAKVEPARVNDPIRGPQWGYRRKARLGCKQVPAKGGVLVGFRERGGRLLADIHSCAVLAPEIGELIQPLRDLLSGLAASREIAQIEIAVGDTQALLVLRNLQPLNTPDRRRLTDFAELHGLALALQSGGPDSVTGLAPAELPPLRYRLDAQDLDLEFGALDFIQINHPVNQALVSATVAALDPASGEAVLDLFCGLGNFSLAVARQGAQVTGLELSPAMVARAQANARANGIDNAQFHSADLSDAATAGYWLGRGWDTLLLDPPRTGAAAVIAALRTAAPQRIVYVSCNPATLARDAGVLVHELGYILASCTVVDMFPHTRHVETLSVFER